MTSIQVESSTETSPLLSPDSEDSTKRVHSLVMRPSHGLSFFQLMKEIYFLMIEEKFSKIFWPLRTRGSEAYLIFKEKFLRRGVKSNNYNTLVLAWLELNMPFKSDFVKFSVFKCHVLSKMGDSHLEESRLNCFYQNAITIWSSLVDPSIEEIKNACLMIVAKTITPPDLKDFHEILSNCLLTLINSQEDLVSLEEFIYLVKNFQDSSWCNPLLCRKICEEFYIFGKRYIIVDFPFSSTGVNPSKILKLYLKDQITKKMNASLNFLENSMDQYIIQKSGENFKDDNDLNLVKNIYFQRILLLMLKLHKIKNVFLENFKAKVQETKIYSNLNKTFKLEEAYLKVFNLYEQGNLIFVSNLLTPTLSFAKIYFGRTKAIVTLKLAELDNHVKIGKIIEKIASKSKHLKYLIISQFKNIITIRIPLRTFENYKSEIKQEIISLYRGIKDLNLQKIRFCTYKLYYQAINQLRAQVAPVKNNLTVQNKIVL